MTDIEEQAVLNLEGELEDPDVVRAAIEQSSLSFSRPLRVDLSRVTYLPSVVIGVFFGAMKSAAATGVGFEVAVGAGTVVHNIALVTALPHVVA